MVAKRVGFQSDWKASHSHTRNINGSSMRLMQVHDIPVLIPPNSWLEILAPETRCYLRLHDRSYVCYTDAGSHYMVTIPGKIAADSPLSTILGAGLDFDHMVTAYRAQRIFGDQSQ